jgi:hypothetical protein
MFGWEQVYNDTSFKRRDIKVNLFFIQVAQH